MHFDTLIHGASLVLPGTGIVRADLAIQDGRVAAILDANERPDCDEVIDASRKFVLPGLIDPHMHIASFPGQPLSDLASETRSAAIGGVTTILNYILKPGSYDEWLTEFVEHVGKLAVIDVGAHVGVFSRDHIADIPRYIDQFGVSSFKFFMPYKANEGTARGVLDVDDGLLFDLFTAIAKHPNTMVNVHAEEIEVIRPAEERAKETGLTGLAAYNAARPTYSEAAAAETAAYYAQVAGAPLYLVHLSSADAIHRARRHRDEGILVETTPHYLSLTVDSDCGALAKVNPPVRTASDVEALWDAVRDGIVDTVGTDHAARLRAQKAGTIWEAAPAFPGIGAMLAVLLTEGYHRRRIPLERIVEISSANAAKIFQLWPRKGSLQVGADADLAVVDLDRERVVDASYLGSRSDFSPWEGQRLKGWAERTLVRGVTVMRDGEITQAGGFGQYLRRPPQPAATPDESAAALQPGQVGAVRI